MKFTLTSTLLFVASALADVIPIQLIARSESAEVNSKGLSSIHEGAGINYFFLGTNAQTLQYDEGAKVIYISLSSDQPNSNQYFAIEGNVLQLTVAAQPLSVEFDADGYAVFAGSNSIYALMNINDPYRYSETSYAVVSYPEGAPEGAIPIRIALAGAAPSPSPSPSPETTTEPESTTVPPEPAKNTTTPAPVEPSTFEGGAALAQGGLAAVAAAAIGLLM